MVNSAAGFGNFDAFFCSTPRCRPAGSPQSANFCCAAARARSSRTLGLHGLLGLRDHGDRVLDQGLLVRDDVVTCCPFFWAVIALVLLGR